MLIFAGTEARCFVLKPGFAAGSVEVLTVVGLGLGLEAPVALDRRRQTRLLLCRSPIRQRLLRPRHHLKRNEGVQSLHVMAVETPAKRTFVR